MAKERWKAATGLSRRSPKEQGPTEILRSG